VPSGTDGTDSIDVLLVTAELTTVVIGAGMVVIVAVAVVGVFRRGPGRDGHCRTSR